MFKGGNFVLPIFLQLIMNYNLLNIILILLKKSVFRLIHSDRDSIPDVPVVYFVFPTEENIHRICQV